MWRLYGRPQATYEPGTAAPLNSKQGSHVQPDGGVREAPQYKTRGWGLTLVPQPPVPLSVAPNRWWGHPVWRPRDSPWLVDAAQLQDVATLARSGGSEEILPDLVLPVSGFLFHRTWSRPSSRASTWTCLTYSPKHWGRHSSTRHAGQVEEEVQHNYYARLDGSLLSLHSGSYPPEAAASIQTGGLHFNHHKHGKRREGSSLGPGMTNNSDRQQRSTPGSSGIRRSQIFGWWRSWVR